MSEPAGEAIKAGAEAVRTAADAIKSIDEIGGEKSGKPSGGPLQILGRLVLGLTALLVTAASVSGFLDSRVTSGVSCSTIRLRYLAGGLIALLIIASCALIWRLVAKHHPAYLSNLSDLSPAAQQELLRVTVLGENVKPTQKPSEPETQKATGQ